MEPIYDDDSDDIADPGGTASNEPGDSSRGPTDMEESTRTTVVDPASGEEAHDRPIIVAEIVGSGGRSQAIEVSEVFSRPSELPPNFQNMAAIGGSVGALLLGIWSIVGATITPYSAINAVIGILMGCWGITSKRKKMAIIGMVLCLVGLGLSVSEINEIISNFFMQVDKS